MSITNKFLNKKDLELVTFQCIKKEFEEIYCKVLNKKTEVYGAISEEQSKIHWSRDWEYPWAIINSNVKMGDKVLDCGCGGSPLLPFLQQFGCEAYGVDPNIFKRMSLFNYYSDLIRRGMKKFRTLNSAAKENITNTSIKEPIHTSTSNSYYDLLKTAIKSLKRPPNDLWGYHKDPNKSGFKIKFFEESLVRTHFPDNYFDKVFCISVIEHLPAEMAYRGMKEMARVLKKGGLLIVTVDNDGAHVTPELTNSYEKLIDESGLRLFGSSDFSRPKPEDVPGTYNVVGFILEK